MVISIFGKHPCNDINFFYNNGKKLEKVKIDSKRIADRYKDIGIYVLKPILDKLIFSFFLNQKFLDLHGITENLEEYKNYIVGSMQGYAIPGSYGLTSASVTKQQFYTYRANLLYQPKGCSSPMFMQVGPKKPGSNLPFMKVTMNPSAFNEQALQEFTILITEQFTVPGKTISYDDFISWAALSEAHIAIDILGTRPCDVEALYVKGSKATKTVAWKSPSGRSETIYFNPKKGKFGDEYLYDKRVELIENDNQPIYGDFLHSRVEFRVKNTTFSKLVGIHNRCKWLSLRALDYEAYCMLPENQQLYIDHALATSLQKVLKKMPEPDKVAFQQIYNHLLKNIWDAEKIWSFWSHEISKSSLFVQQKCT